MSKWESSPIFGVNNRKKNWNHHPVILSCFNPAFNKAQIEILFWHSCFSGLLLCHHIATWWKHLHFSGGNRSDHFYFSRARSNIPAMWFSENHLPTRRGHLLGFRGWNYGEISGKKLHVIGADLLIWCFNRPKLMFRNKIPKNTLKNFFFIPLNSNLNEISVLRQVFTY